MKNTITEKIIVEYSLDKYEVSKISKKLTSFAQ